jgi:hypothetical protein
MNPRSIPNQIKKNLFDWMGMNEEILDRPKSNLEFWFFPKFVILCNAYKIKSWVIPITTPLNSFTDGLIPSVKGMNSVGEIITDGHTDGPRPSVY